MKTSTSIKILTLLGTLTAAGCQLHSDVPTLDAVAEIHTEESIRELESTIARALNMTSVVITATAFTKLNRLTIERKPIFTSNNELVEGRIDEKPNVFSLSLKGEKCVLKQQKTQKTWVLKNMKCVPLSQ